MGALSFNEMEIDALGEMMNISLGASATAMSTLLGSTVHITTPKVKILTRDQFEFKKLAGSGSHGTRCRWPPAHP